MRRWWKRLFIYPLLAASAVVILAEEVLWRLSKLLPSIRPLEEWIRGLPPYGALCLFGVPSVALAPIKLLALYWLAGGHPVLGVGTIFTAKIAGTALVARLFQLTKPALLRIGWFAWCHDRVVRVRAAAYDLWRNSAAGRLFSRIRTAIRRHYRRLRYGAVNE